MPKDRKDKQVYNIFLSYDSSDKEYARKIEDSLISQQPSLRIFTTSKLSAGENWPSKLRQALSSCDIFMVILSPNAMRSKWVLHELGAAWGLDKVIIPIVTNLNLPLRIPVNLSEEQLLEVRDFEDTKTINQILERYEQGLDVLHSAS